MNREKIIESLKKNNVKFIKLQFSDLLGIIKHVDVPVTLIDDVLDGKTMFDGSSIEGFARINESDMLLVPDLDSYKIISWEKNYDDSNIATFICSVVKPNGELFEGDPRNILIKTLEKVKDYGFGGVNIGFEPEFFLFENNDKKIELADQGGYFFDNSTFDKTNQVRKEIVMRLLEMGYDIEAAHHEVSKSQHEINFKYSDALSTADNVQIFKYGVKSIANKNNLHATFMPKPVSKVNGSGMHTNISLFDKNGNNSFYDESGESQLSNDAYSFIAGILKYANELTLLANPTVNSYKRLVPGFEAPCYKTYSDSNRSSMIRIPTTRKEGTRIEIRSVDPTANPYLVLSALINAGLKGIEQKLEPGTIVNENIFSMTSEEKIRNGIFNLPESLREAINYYQESEFCKSTLGEHAYYKYLSNKTEEWDSYRLAVHEWELNWYLDLY